MLVAADLFEDLLRQVIGLDCHPHNILVFDRRIHQDDQFLVDQLEEGLQILDHARHSLLSVLNGAVNVADHANVVDQLLTDAQTLHEEETRGLFLLHFQLSFHFLFEYFGALNSDGVCAPISPVFLCDFPQVGSFILSRPVQSILYEIFYARHPFSPSFSPAFTIFTISTNFHAFTVFHASFM